jgi:flagellar basal-body rod protein FlgB
MVIDVRMIDMLSRQLDEKMARNRLIASNVANIDTPGFKAKDISFETALKSSQAQLQLRLTAPEHMPGSLAGTGQVVESKTPGRPDGNNVDLDEEMLKLSKNNIEYNTAVQFMTKRMTMMRNALDDLRRS